MNLMSNYLESWQVEENRLPSRGRILSGTYLLFFNGRHTSKIRELVIIFSPPLLINSTHCLKVDGCYPLPLFMFSNNNMVWSRDLIRKYDNNQLIIVPGGGLNETNLGNTISFYNLQVKKKKFLLLFINGGRGLSKMSMNTDNCFM